jgi:hypothetical protein
MSEPILDLASMRFLNESAIRSHALRCSARLRANKFTRVGEDFLDEVKADVEAVLRELRNKATLHMPPALIPNESFVTGVLKDRAAVILDELVGRIVQNKVQRQPSRG